MSGLTKATEALGNGGTTTAVYRAMVAVITILIGLVSTMIWRGVDGIKTELSAATSAVSAVRVQQSKDTTAIGLIREQMDRELEIQGRVIQDHEQRLRQMEHRRELIQP